MIDNKHLASSHNSIWQGLDFARKVKLARSVLELPPLEIATTEPLNALTSKTNK